MNAPLISIITPNYNAVSYIALTIESVLNQTYQNWEMLIQDDCSSDGSYEIALEYARKDSRIKVGRNEKNSGTAVTRNKAIEIANGDYLAFLDSDDIWFPEKLEKQLDFMLKNNCDFSFSEYEQISENNQSCGKKIKTVKKLTYAKLLMHEWPGCLTVMYDQRQSGKIYTPDVRKNNDRALFLQVVKKMKNAMGIPECLALYRIQAHGISRNKFKMLKAHFIVSHYYANCSVLTSIFLIFTQFFIKSFFITCRDC